MSKKTIQNLVTAGLLAFALALFVFPEFKAVIIRGLMKAGFFQPRVTAIKATPPEAATASIQFITESGAIHTPGSLKGKVVFINFWATWCPPCIAEMPAISELYTAFKHNPNIIFLLVDADQDLAKATAFIKKKELSLPVSSFRGTVPSSWYSGTLPTTLVLDKTGNPVYQHEGTADFSNKKFRAFLEGLTR
ncbi:TlpA family protein disulfide reductase [Niabella drilacis]|uniref:Thiol-disulfide isomerase or thioredoxin n=1 Tax=Niabella drilacis (strain DSM 25811 / CCM 8410 / CCUG 62505 / LMG 26954 / E90) TaxID=1285928 RepID=A0A1G6NK48_NIADE|nr:TlpA disulfide reductase family protein [Niabella drilacis]SDC67696.1 Thiol-disulfide isomerase or thioredoxin [Niabella drilacis]